MSDETVPVKKVRVYRDKAGEWRWQAKAGNNETVADSSEGYASRQHAEDMAERMFPNSLIVSDPN